MAYSPEDDRGYGGWRTNPSPVARMMTPDQLDPLEASSSPISVEPSAGGADQDAIALLMAQGMTYPQAAARVAAEKAAASADMQARIDAASAPRAAPAPAALEEPNVSPETLREYGYMSQAEPGPTSVRGGGKPTPGQQFNKMSEAIGYMTRPVVTDANRREAAAGAAYLPSARDRDMAARGFFPVYADDGSVSYSVGTGREAIYPQDEGRGIRGGLGRLGPRRDLQETDPSQPGFTLERTQGPTGENYIYKQNDAARNQQAAYMKERQLYRMAQAAGMSPAEFAAQNEGAFGAIAANPEAKARMMVQGKRQADEAARLALWKSQMMLAGSNPAKNAVNAYNQLNDPSTNDWQRAVMANALVPGMDNTTPLTVDAMGAQNAMRFVNTGNTGANNPLVRAQAEQLARDAAISRADTLIAKYRKGWDGMYSAADVDAVRRAVDLQHPGMGAAAVAHQPRQVRHPSPRHPPPSVVATVPTRATFSEWPAHPSLTSTIRTERCSSRRSSDCCQAPTTSLIL